MECYKLTNATIYPILFLIILTLVVGFIHTYGSISMLINDKFWKKNGIPRDPKHKAPESLLMVKNNLKNLFEFPVIFYFISALAYMQNIDDLFFIITCWIYVSIRLVHSYAHIYLIDTTIRGPAWLFSQVVLSLLVIRFIMLI